VPVPVVLTANVKVTALNPAMIVLSAVRLNVQEPVPVHVEALPVPVHPVNADPAAGDAVQEIVVESL